MATNNDHYNNGVVYRTPEGQLYDTSDLTYLMSPLLDVVVEATASPETKNRMQLEYNKKWQDWHKLYLDWWKNYKAAESKAELSDMNNYVRKGMDDFGRNYVFPAMTTALTAGLPVISTAGKAAEVLWNPATTITSRFANPLVRAAGKTADMIGLHLPVYRETAADIVSKASGDKNWFTDLQGNFDPFTTAETVFAPFIGAGAVKEGKEIYNFAKTLPTEVELYRTLRNPKIPADYNTPIPQKVRTRLGDVEIDDTNLAYRLGENIAEDFLKTKTVRTPDEPNYNNHKITLTSGKTLQLGKSFRNPMFSLGHLWYGVPTSPYSELLVTAEPLAVASKSSQRLPSEVNGTFDIRNYRGNKSGTRRVPMDSKLLSPLNTSVYRWDPNYGYRKLREEPSTSLKFFERPSKISLAEKIGLPKGDRNNLNKFLKDALEDLNLYINSGQYRLLPTINLETSEPSWVSPNGNVSAIRLLIEDGAPQNGRNSWAWNRPNGGVYELTTDGAGNFGIGYNSFRLFDVAPEFNTRIGEASAGSARHGYSKIFLTAPRNDARLLITETPELELAKKTLIETQPPRINKNIMRDFWSGVQLSLRPGAYLSGDEGALPKGATLIRSFKDLSSKGHRYDNDNNIVGTAHTTWEDIKNLVMRPEKWKRRETGLSTDSYLSLLKLANREGSPYYLRYSPDGFTTFNSQSIDNKFISDLLEKTKTGEATQLEFLDAFHNWVSPYGGMDARIVNGEIVIPHPFLYKKKDGGKLYTPIIQNNIGNNYK